MHLEKTTDTGEWQKGRYYVAGETFTYENLLFYVTEDHFSSDFHPKDAIASKDLFSSDFHPEDAIDDGAEGFPFRRVYEAASVTSLTRKKKGQ